MDCPLAPPEPCPGFLCPEWRSIQPRDGGLQQSLQDRKPLAAAGCPDARATGSRCGGKDGLL